MAPHSSTLAWKIPWTEEPGGLQSMGSAKSQTRLKRLGSSSSILLLLNSCFRLTLIESKSEKHMKLDISGI